jgi:hypothetical protein
MRNQAFSPQNLRTIFDSENRRGVYLEGDFFPEIAKLTQAVKVCMADIRELKRRKQRLVPQYYELQKAMLNEEKLKLKNQKEKLIAAELEAISQQISEKGFRINLHEVVVPNKKKAYSIPKTAAAYFAVKQLQSNVRRLYKVKQGNRSQIICQLKSILSDSFPKYVIRTDIDDFYESISSVRLLKKLDEDPLLTLPSRKLTRQMLQSYRDLTGATTGIPRGIGISAYLSELYIRQFDEAVKSHEAVLYYARFVDDIVVIFSPRPNSPVQDLLPFITAQAASLGLTLNQSKTFQYDARDTQLFEMEYLGYKITFGDGSLRVALSDKRKTKYESRIELCFNAYSKQAGLNEKRARRLLKKRIQFLTGNTRLLNNKSNILTGVFYSNSLITSASELAPLDQKLRTQIDSITSATLKSALYQLSFEEGFVRKRYQSFTTNELAEITRPWKYEA